MSSVSVTVRELYDTRTRPSLVYKTLLRFGAEKYLDPKQIEMISKLTTVQALMDKSVEIQQVATPYIKKATHADGRKELAVLANDNIVKPTFDVASARAKPYVSKANEVIIQPARERVAPLVDVLERNRLAIVGSPRFKRALEGVNKARAHPIETAQELRSNVIDLIKYDNLVSYREYVLSPEFQADTLKLLKEDLPMIAREAARRGYGLLHSSSVALSDELHAKRAALADAWKHGFQMGHSSVELQKLRDTALKLVDQLKAKLLTTAEKVQAKGSELTTEYHVREAIERITKIFGLDGLFRGGGGGGGAVAGDAQPAPTDDGAHAETPMTSPSDEPSHSPAATTSSE
ncbi:hypothetical protein KFE25_007723 [Diacronema lutheri]|uniref:Uncharacterized protein n=1 Tax=Diacronema lutheri TaxID=2081491 RepID=A0A8J6CGK1_DIALT|nr:hypothetical protein KFE25_007723 [Diacronema lutheri]